MSQSFYIHPTEARRQFRELAESPLDVQSLARGALLIALEDQPALEIDEAMNSLDELAGRVSRRSGPGVPEIFKLGHLHSEMFDIDGFRGEEQNYHDVRNVYLNEVLRRKRGIPITLSIIFLHVAYRIGLDAVGVGLPGHYIVKVRFPLNELYVDPFHSGSTLSMAEIGQLVTNITGGNQKLRSEHLRAWSVRETLIRVLANLQNFHARKGNQRASDAARERMELLVQFGKADHVM